MLDHDPEELGISDDELVDDARIADRLRRFIEQVRGENEKRIAALEKEVSDLKALLKAKGVI